MKNLKKNLNQQLQYTAHLGLKNKTIMNILLLIIIYSLFNVNSMVLCMLDGSNSTEVCEGHQSNIIETLQAQIIDLSNENRAQQEEITILRSIIRDNTIEIARLQLENTNLNNQITNMETTTQEHCIICSCTIL